MPAHRPSRPDASAEWGARSLSRGLLALILSATPAVRGAARGGTDAVPGRRIDRLVAGPGRLFALRGGEVVTFDGVGQPLGRCSGFASPPSRETRAPLGAPDADEVLQAAGLADDDSSPDAEDALADEGLGPKRRRRGAPETGVEPRALVATAADEVWIATSSGVFRGDEMGCATAGLRGRDLIAVAASGGVVIAASEDLLFRREAEDDGEDDNAEGDGGAIFTVAAGLASRPRALAIDAEGQAIVADDDGVSIVGADDTSTRVLDRATDAVAVCGNVAIALSDDGVYAWSPGVPPRRAGDRPPARALACGRTARERWIATGLGVWTSADGATWVERPEMLGRSVTGAAIVGDRLWLAAEDGLVAIDVGPETAASAEAKLGAAPAGGLPALSTRRLLAPAIPWPWVTAALGAERTPDRRAWSFMVLLTFPLGRAGAGRIDPTSLANELVRRDLALAAEETDLRATPASDEIDARLAAVQQEREALR